MAVALRGVMPAPRCIVAATDFSGTSRESLAVARDLAGAIGARVHIIHVIPDPAQLPWTIDTGLSLVSLERSWRKQAEVALERARAESGMTPDQAVISVVRGDAATEIGKEAARLRADFIVIGTHGHGLVARLLMGSVADKVVRHAERPVLLVPHPALKHLEPVGAVLTEART
jgi:nucleotide-binding universal stress UspA family protein